jgi:16S rRNA (guanine527-N7)-methyltransferase
MIPCRTVQVYLQAIMIGNWSLLEQVEPWGIEITSECQTKLEYFLTLLYEKNEHINLTRVPKEHAVGRHILDSLSLFSAATLSEGVRVLDVGTGAGLPGVVIKIVRPDARVTLLDSHGKTMEFLKETCQTLGLTGMQFKQRRAEEWAHLPEAREQFDWVVARALARMPVLVELMLPYVRLGGAALALRSEHEWEAIEAVSGTAHFLGARMTAVRIAFNTEEGQTSRYIACFRKEQPTPKEYPRRWAIIQQQPLGGKA